jgi:hypothetical protein
MKYKSSTKKALLCQLLLRVLFFFGDLLGLFDRALCGFHFLAGGDRRFLGHALLELFHAAGGVDQLLLARKEGVARRTKLNVNFFAGRAGRINLAASADDLRLGEISGMDVFFHNAQILSKILFSVKFRVCSGFAPGFSRVGTS